MKAKRLSKKEVKQLEMKAERKLFVASNIEYYLETGEMQNGSVMSNSNLSVNIDSFYSEMILGYGTELLIGSNKTAIYKLKYTGSLN